MATLDETPCCGVQFIDMIDDSPESVLVDVCEKKYNENNDWDEYAEPLLQAFLIFTDNVSDNNFGEELADYITKHKLGGVKASRQRRNPNTDNMIRVWIWSPNERNLKAWYRKHN